MTEQSTEVRESPHPSVLVRDPQLLTLAATSFTATLGSGAIAPALPAMAVEFGVSDARIGLLMTALTLPGIVLTLVLSVFSDIYGRRTVLLPSMTIFGVAGTVIMFVDSFTSVLILRLVQGIVISSIIPLAITVISELYSGPAGAAAQGVRVTANGISQLVVPTIAGFLVGFAWNYAFLLYLLVFPVAAAGYLFLPETATVSSGDTQIIEEVRAWGHAIYSDLTEVDMSIVVLGGFARGFTFYGVLTFVPLFAVGRFGVTPFLVGIILAVRGFVRIFIAPFTGHFLRMIARKTLLLLGLVVAAVGILTMALAPSAVWLGVAMGVYAVGDSIFAPVFKDTVADLADDENRAGIVGGQSVLRKIGTTIAPIFFGGVLTVAGFESIFVIASGVLTLYAVLLAAVLTLPSTAS